MRFVKFMLVLVLMFFSKLSFSQNKAFVIQNIWDNNLNNYNPKNFYTSLFDLFKTTLAVKEFVADPTKLSVGGIEADWDKKVSSEIVRKNAPADSIYYIAFASQLRLPVINLGKFFFKNPPRSSKLIFTYHVYNGAGTEILGDTIINRGCLTNSIQDGKSSQFFYSDFNSFNKDLMCHLDYITQQLRERQLPKKGK